MQSIRGIHSDTDGPVNSAFFLCPQQQISMTTSSGKIRPESRGFYWVRTNHKFSPWMIVDVDYIPFSDSEPWELAFRRNEQWVKCDQINLKKDTGERFYQVFPPSDDEKG